MSWTRTAVLLAAAVLPAAACSDLAYEPTNGLEIAGTYVINAGKGEFIYTDDSGKTFDLASEGSQVTVTIRADGTISSHIFVPPENASAESYEVTLPGTWQLQGSMIYFVHNNGEATVLSTIPFVVLEGKLVGEKQYVDGYIKMTLVK